jgi:IS5 family transposase
MLAQRSIQDRMTARACRNKPLTNVQKVQNRLWAGTRCTVARTFGMLKLHCGMEKARCLGLKRNAGWLGVAWIQHKARFKFAA